MPRLDDLDRSIAERSAKNPEFAALLSHAMVLRRRQYRVRRFWSRLCRWPGNRLQALRMFYQRGRRGWSDGDASTLDYTVAKLLASMLAYHAAHAHGFPGEHANFPEGQTPEAWQAYVFSLSQAFEDYAVAMGGEDDPPLSDEQLEPLQDAMRRLFDHFQYLWD
jgi:hypothetical protein